MNDTQKMKLEFFISHMNLVAEPLSEIFDEVSENDRNEYISIFYDQSTIDTDGMIIDIATSPKYMSETIDVLNRKYDLVIKEDEEDEEEPDNTPLTNEDLVKLLIGRVGVVQAMKLISAEIK